MANTRQRLIEAAAERFWGQGYEKTSLAAVCREAGANPGSMYYFFPSKQDLLAAVLESHDHALAGVVDDVWLASPEPVERIFGLLDTYRARLLTTGFERGCPVGTLASEVSDPSKEARERIVAYFDRWLNAVEECLSAARDRLPRGLDRRELATFVLTTMEGGVMQARATQRIEPYDRSVGQLWDYLELLFQAAGGEGPI